MRESLVIERASRKTVLTPSVIVTNNRDNAFNEANDEPREYPTLF